MRSENKRVIKLEYEIDDNWNWFAQDQDGSVTIFEDKPNLVDGMWDSDGAYKVLSLENSGVILESNWEESLKSLSEI
jgi:hypothetical protein